MSPPFADLRSIFSARDCFYLSEPMRVYSESCDIWNRSFNYPLPTVLFASIFHFTQSTIWVLGDFFALLLITTLSYWFYFAYSRKPNIYTISIFALIGVSPTTLLLEERGNYDTVIFSLFTLGLLWTRQNKSKFAIVVFFFAGLLKVYLIPLNFIIALIDPKPKNRQLSMSLFSLNCLLFIPTAIDIYRNTPVSLPNSFGFQFFYYFSNGLLIICFSLIIIALLLFAIFQKFSHEISFSPHLFRGAKFNNSEIFYLLALFGFCIPYFATVSFNYRIIFILPIAVLNYTSMHNRIRVMGFVLFMMQFAVAFNKSISVSIFVNSALLVVIVVLLIESILNWGKSIAV